MSSRLTDAGGNFLVDELGNYLVWLLASPTGSMTLASSAPSITLTVAAPSITLTSSED